ncbi:MAG TPA: hypothetical protein DEV87_03185 [Clostridiales bacterium]|nr:hypothetical protein [Clostridiales bacterium]
MQEVFYEESAKCGKVKSGKTKYYILLTLGALSFAAGILWFLIALFNTEFGKGSIILNILFLIFPTALFIGFTVVALKFKNNFCIDYDYTFITGSVKIAKVVKDVKRYPVISFETGEIEKLGKVGSDTYERYASSPDLDKIVVTSNEYPEDGKDFYYIVVNTGGSKKLLFAECTKDFIKLLLRYSSKTVLDGKL